MSNQYILPLEKSLSFSSINAIENIGHRLQELVDFIDKDNPFLTDIHVNTSLNVSEAGKASILTAILYNPRIQSITIEGEMDRQTANWIAKLRRMEGLERLTFGGFITTPSKSQERAIAYMLQTNATLQELSLFALYSDTTERFLTALARNARPNVALRKLTIQHCHATYNSFEAIGQILERLPSLVSLDIAERRNEIGSPAVCQIAQGIEQNSSLTRITIHAKRLSKGAGKHILTSLVTRTNLKAVYLGSLRFNIGRLAAQVVEANPSLEEFSLTRISHWRFREGGLDTIALGHAVTLSTCLTTLSLDGFILRAEGITTLCDSLRLSDSLQSLRFCGGNILDEEGMNSICDLISSSTSLKRPDLSRNGLACSAIVPLLCEAVASSESLEDLNLCRNLLSEDDFKHLGRMLLRNTSLKALRLWPWQWQRHPTEQSFRALVEGVKAHPAITSIQLLFNTTDSVSLRQELDFYLELNRGPKRILAAEVPQALWPLVLKRASDYGNSRTYGKPSPDLLFHFVREKCDLFDVGRYR